MPDEPEPAFESCRVADSATMPCFEDAASLRPPFPREAEAPPRAANVRIQDMPAEERPREKMLRHGGSALTDAELLALFFRTGTQGLSAIEIGRRLIEKYGDLTTIGRLRPVHLQKEKGLGPAKALDLAAAYELGKRLAAAQWEHQPMDDPEVVSALLGPELRAEPVEVLKLILLNSRMNKIGIEEISRGGLTDTAAHPREILRCALAHNAAGFVLVHNHPAGDPRPSALDVETTRKVRDAAALLQVRFVDHVIIGMPVSGRQEYYSFREIGML